MIGIILNDIWLDVKKNALIFILSIAAYIGIAVFGFVLTFAGFIGNLNTAGKEQSLQALTSIINSPETQFYGSIIGSAASIILLILLLRNIPIRLSKPMYVCAAGREEKMHYLRLHLLIKVLVSFAFIILLQICTTGCALITSDYRITFVQLGLWVFLLISLNLRVDPGNRKEILNSQPTWESEKSGEVVAYIYWLSLLIIENIAFYAVLLLKIHWSIWIFLIWIVLFIINILIARYCITPVLTYMLSYEKIYYPLPEEKE